MSITKNEARQIADAMLDAATAIDKYLDENWETIERPQYETLSEEAKTLLRISSFLTTEIINLAIADMEKPGEKLKEIIGKAKEKLDTLKKVGAVIRVVAAIVNLGTSLLSKDPGAIIKSANDLMALIKQV